MKKKNKKQKGFPSMLKMEIPILKIKILYSFILAQHDLKEKELRLDFLTEDILNLTF